MLFNRLIGETVTRVEVGAAAGVSSGNVGTLYHIKRPPLVPIKRLSIKSHKTALTREEGGDEPKRRLVGRTRGPAAAEQKPPGHSGPTPATRILLTPRINTNKKPISRAYHDCRAYYPPEFIHFYGKTERD